MNIPVINFIQSDNYDGPDRRDKDRYSVLVAAELEFAGKKELVKVLNIGHGGCRLHCTMHLNPHSIITLAFYVEGDDRKMEQKYPVTGRVIKVHKTKGHDVVWIDFKGMLVQEQGLDAIMEKGKRN